jgi:signal transduction histidine kinase
MVLLSQALTERVKKIKESELVKESLNRELEQKVKERTEALSIQKNIIEEKVKTLDTFIYKASHDIKGPLKSLIGVATLGMKDTPDNAPIYFNHALKTAHKLDAIVKDLLHITQINNARLNLIEINFKEIIIDILESLSNLPGYEKMKFEIDIQQEDSFYSEKVLIYSIFQNFIENGIKYRNPEAKTNKLKIHIHGSSGLWEIKFIDNGIGIKEEYYDKIFEMFFKISEQSDDSTGLGLYIVKLSIERLEGQVFVQSKIGEETSFTVMLKNKIPELKEIPT